MRLVKCSKTEYSRFLRGSEIREFSFLGVNILGRVVNEEQVSETNGGCNWLLLECAPGGTGRDGKLEDVALCSDYSDFQMLVYSRLLETKAGELVSYSKLAERCGCPTAVRAVAHAVASNRFAIMIPCHRVVPKSGGYGNYRWGKELKVRMIEAELLSQGAE